jgi:hypothetical protein
MFIDNLTSFDRMHADNHNTKYPQTCTDVFFVILISSMKITTFKISKTRKGLAGVVGVLENGSLVADGIGGDQGHVRLKLVDGVGTYSALSNCSAVSDATAPANDHPRASVSALSLPSSASAPCAAFTCPLWHSVTKQK